MGQKQPLVGLNLIDRTSVEIGKFAAGFLKKVAVDRSLAVAIATAPRIAQTV